MFDAEESSRIKSLLSGRPSDQTVDVFASVASRNLPVGINLAVALDCTGTLTNDESLHREIWAEIWQEIGCYDQIDHDVIWNKYYGIGNPAVHEDLIKEDLLTENSPYYDFAYLDTVFMEKYRQRVADGQLTLRPGMEQFLQHCQNYGFPIFVPTNDSRALLELKFKHFGFMDEDGNLRPNQPIKVVVTGEEGQLKPSPDLVLKGFEKLTTLYPNTRFHLFGVEDSAKGILGMRRAAALINNQNRHDFAFIMHYPYDDIFERDPYADHLVRPELVFTDFRRAMDTLHSRARSISPPPISKWSPALEDVYFDNGNEASGHVIRDGKARFTQIFEGVISQGYRIASGQAEENKFGDSSLNMQMPIFSEFGLDLERILPGMYLGTINVDMPKDIMLILSKKPGLMIDASSQPVYTHEEIMQILEAGRSIRIENVNWAPDVPGRGPENFDVMLLRFEHEGAEYNGLLYYPDPFTKKEQGLGAGAPEHHWNRLEVICPEIPALMYGKGYGQMAKVRLPNGSFTEMTVGPRPKQAQDVSNVPATPAP